jgi:uncharacterized protein YkwD
MNATWRGLTMVGVLILASCQTPRTRLTPTPIEAPSQTTQVTETPIFEVTIEAPWATATPLIPVYSTPLVGLSTPAATLVPIESAPAAAVTFPTTAPIPTQPPEAAVRAAPTESRPAGRAGEALPVSDVPPISFALPPSGDVAAAEQYTIDLINAQRLAAGVAPLRRDEVVMGIARARVADMVARGYTGHNDPVTGESLARSMLTAAGYGSSFIGENWYGSSQGPPRVADIAMGWFMTDPPHAQNILNPNYAAVGVGIAYNGRQWLLVQNFVGQ